MLFCLMFVVAQDDMAPDIAEIMEEVRKSLKGNPFFDRSPTASPDSVSQTMSQVEQGIRDGAEAASRNQGPFHEDVAELLKGSADNVHRHFPNRRDRRDLHSEPPAEAVSTGNHIPPEVRVLDRVQQQVNALLAGL